MYKKSDMNRIVYLFVFMLLGFCFAGIQVGYSQDPTYELRITNQQQISPKVYQFDVYLLNTSSVPFELASLQFGIGFDTSIANGGNLSFSLVSGSSQLVASQVPTSFAVGSTIRSQNGITYRFMNQAARIGPGAGNGTLISTNNQNCSNPGTRLGTYRLTNTSNFRINSSPKHIINSVNAAGMTRTAVSAYLNGLNTVISGMDLGYNSVGTCDVNLLLNACNINLEVVNLNHVDCYGASDGSFGILMSEAGIDSTSTYSINGGSPILFSGNGFSVSGLGGGNYDISVNSGICPAVATQVQITSPTNPSVSRDTVTACDSYSWNGNTYTNSGVYTFNTTNALSCDSTAILNLTISSSGRDTISLTMNPIQAPYLWNGMQIDSSGTYVFNATSSAGCDSLSILVLDFRNKKYILHANHQTYEYQGQTYDYIGDSNWSDEELWNQYPGDTILAGDTVLIEREANCMVDQNVQFNQGSVFIIDSAAYFNIYNEFGFNCKTINRGIIYNVPQLTINDTLFNYGTLSAWINIPNGKVMVNYGELVNWGQSFMSIYNGKLINYGTINSTLNDIYFSEIINYGLIHFPQSTDQIWYGTNFVNYGKLINEGLLYTLWNFTWFRPSSFTNYGIVSNEGWIENGDYGIINNYGDFKLNVYSNHQGRINNYDTLTLNTGGFTNNIGGGSIGGMQIQYYGSGIISNFGTIIEKGNLYSYDSIINNPNSKLVIQNRIDLNQWEFNHFINKGNLQIDSGALLISYRNFKNDSTAVINGNGELVFTDNFINDGTINANNYLVFYKGWFPTDSVINNGIINSNFYINTDINFYNRGTINSVGTFDLYDSLFNYSTINLNGSLIGFGSIDNFDEGILICNGIISPGGHLDLAPTENSFSSQRLNRSTSSSSYGCLKINKYSSSAKFYIEIEDTNRCVGHDYVYIDDTLNAARKIDFAIDYQPTLNDIITVIQSDTVINKFDTVNIPEGWIVLYNQPQIGDVSVKYVGPCYDAIVLDTLRHCGSSTSISARSGFDSYLWSNGSTTQSITVNASRWYYCTVAKGDCSSTDSIFVAFTSPTSRPVPTSIVIQPITSNVCGARKYRYIAPVLPVNASGYEWSFVGSLFNGSGTIDSGSINSRIITVTYSSNMASGTGDSVKLRYSSPCGFGNFRSLRLSNTNLLPPNAPASITIQAVSANTCGARRYRYIAPALSAATASNGVATGWLWELTGNLAEFATIDSGDENARVIVVTYSVNSASAVGDSIRLYYQSDCGFSKYRVLKMTNTKLNAPLAPASITIQSISANVCGARRYRYVAPSLPLATASSGAVTGWEWNMPTGSLGANAILDSGTLNSRTIIILYTSNQAAASTDSIRLRYVSDCGYSPFRAAKLTNTLLNAPLAPASISMALVQNECGARIYRYVAPVLPVATASNGAAVSYDWMMPFGPLGSIGVLDSGTLSGRTIRIRYSSNNASSVGDSIRVRYSSGCGFSGYRTVRLSNTLRTGCTLITKTVSSGRSVVESENKTEDMETILYPNPSTSSFNIEVKTNSPEPVQIQVSDMQGRRLGTLRTSPNNKFTFGEKWNTGVYLLEVKQGKQIKTLKAIKNGN